MATVEELEAQVKAQQAALDEMTRKRDSSTGPSWEALSQRIEKTEQALSRYEAALAKQRADEEAAEKEEATKAEAAKAEAEKKAAEAKQQGAFWGSGKAWW